MPLIVPKKGQSQKKFIADCMGNPTMLKEFPDQKQRAAVCFSQYRKKRSKASYVVASADDEFIYIVTRMVLPAALQEKVRKMPESMPGIHKVKIKMKNGTYLQGMVYKYEEFETGEDMDEMSEEDMEDIEAND